MAKKKKQTAYSRVVQPTAPTPPIAPKEQVPQKTKGAKFLPNINPVSFAELALGKGQDYARAPLDVPNGFTTEIPYNTTINSTIIANPSPIPIANFFHALTTDPVVYSSMLYLTTCIIKRIGDYNNPDNEDAQKLVRDTIERVGRRKLIQGMLTSLWAGFAAIKLNWDVIDGVTAIKNIQILPPTSILLAVTPEGQLDPDFGVMQYYYNINSQWNQNPVGFASTGTAPYAPYGSVMTPDRQLTYNPMYISAVPEDWRLLYTFNPIGMAGNHYGMSMLNSIWSKILGKNNQLMKIEIATTYKAAPLVIFRTDTQTQVETSNGYKSVAENLQDTLADGTQSGYLIVEGKDSIEFDVINNDADLLKMWSIVQGYNDEIRAGLISPNLVGNAGSYANAMANSTSHDEMIENITEDLVYALTKQLARKIIDYGIGEVEDYGFFEIREESLDERAIWAKILEVAKSMGAIDPNNITDINTIRTKLGFAPVNDLSDDLVMSVSMAMMDGGAMGTNINGMKQDAGVKYANGGVKEIKKDQYGS